MLPLIIGAVVGVVSAVAGGSGQEQPKPDPHGHGPRGPNEKEGTGAANAGKLIPMDMMANLARWGFALMAITEIGRLQ